MIKLIIFDLDGVLTSTSKQHFEAWERLSQEYGLLIDESVEESTKGVSRMDSLNIILDLSNSKDKYTTLEKNIMAQRKNEIYIELISKYNRSSLFEGVIELLEFLKEKNILIALGSASLNGPMLIKRLEIDKYFDYIVNPSDLKSKPSPDIFLDAAKHFNLKGSECIGIEDASAGVKAINAANMYSIGIGDKSVLSSANIVVDCIKSIDFEFLNTLIKEC